MTRGAEVKWLTRRYGDPCGTQPVRSEIVSTSLQKQSAISKSKRTSEARRRRIRDDIVSTELRGNLQIALRGLAMYLCRRKHFNQCDYQLFIQNNENYRDYINDTSRDSVHYTIKYNKHTRIADGKKVIMLS